MFKLNRSYKLVDEHGFISETLSVNRTIASFIKTKTFTVTKLDRDHNVVEIRVGDTNYSPAYFDSNVSIIISPEESKYFEELPYDEYIILQFGNDGKMGGNSRPMSKEETDASILEYLSRNPGCKVKVFKYSHTSEFKISEFKE